MNRENLVLLTKKLYRLTILFPKKEPLRFKIREVAGDVLTGYLGKKRESNGFSLKESLEIIDSLFEVAIDQNWVAPGDILEIKKEYAKINKDLEGEEEMPRASQASVVGVSENGDIPASGDDSESELPEDFPSDAENAEPGKEGLGKENGQACGSREEPWQAGKGREGGSVSSAIQISNPVPLISATGPAQVFAANKADEGSDVCDCAEETDEEKGTLTAGQIERQQRIVEFLKEKGKAQVWEIQTIFPNISKRTIRRDFRLLLKQGSIERVGERNKTYYKLKVNLS